MAKQVNLPSTDGYEDWQHWGQSLTRALVNWLFVGAVEIGRISEFKGTSVPDGWLLCNGATFLKDSYPTLYIALGNSNVLPNLSSVYGAGFVVGIKAA